MANRHLSVASSCDDFGELPRGINHIGVTVPDLELATVFFQQALGAKWAYDGLTSDDEPRQGIIVEKQLNLPQGAKIIKQRVFRLGNGPNLEVFEIKAPTQRPPLKLNDFGINHLSLYCDDIEACLARIKAAGGVAIDELHENSKHEDTPNNASIYTLTPWHMLIELQTIPKWLLL
ncbi:VOC family protein [Acinetobacter rathckeae]|uniref:VOC family protein n=1 Tax=Acinetobacter rathckeae TaxID=2605272 RepID=UPI001BB3B607|nr:VOC family protein [Acinetobacter rathckeae]